MTYIIWQTRIWSVQRHSEGWRPCGISRASCYAGPDDTAVHRDHVHVSVNGDTAGQKTSESSGRIVTTLAAYRLTARFGQCSSRWRACHTGLDFAAPTGPPDPRRRCRHRQLCRLGWRVRAAHQDPDGGRHPSLVCPPVRPDRSGRRTRGGRANARQGGRERQHHRPSPAFGDPGLRPAGGTGDLVSGERSTTITWSFDGNGHLYDLGGESSVETYGPPPPIRWIAVDDLTDVFGRRIALSKRNGPVYDHRAASEVCENSGGRYVNIVSEAQWWAWAILPDDQRPPRIPRAKAWSSRHVWVEVRNQPAGDDHGR